MEPKKQKRKAKYTVMVVSDMAEGQIRQFTITSRIFHGLMAFILLLVAVLGIFVLIRSISYVNQKNSLVNLERQLDELKKTNEALAISNDELSEKNAILSDTIVQKVEVEEAAAAEEALKFVPSGIPVSRALSITEVGLALAEGETADAAGTTEGTDDTAVTEAVPTEQTYLVEFLVRKGSDVMATGDGTVIFVGDDAEYGKIIKIDHGNGYLSIYRYNSNYVVNVNDVITRGTVLFELNSGNQKLGYQIQLNEQYVDPMELMEIYG